MTGPEKDYVAQNPRCPTRRRSRGLGGRHAWPQGKPKAASGADGAPLRDPGAHGVPWRPSAVPADRGARPSSFRLPPGRPAPFPPWPRPRRGPGAAVGGPRGAARAPSRPPGMLAHTAPPTARSRGTSGTFSPSSPGSRRRAPAPPDGLASSTCSPGPRRSLGAPATPPPGDPDGRERRTPT